MSAPWLVDDVEEARARLDNARPRLADRVAAAVEAGHPVAVVARAAGVTRQTVYRWAAGEPVAPAGYEEQYGVIVICTDEADQHATYDRLLADGYANVRVVVT